MAVSSTVVDSINNPDNTKTVTTDIKLLVDATSEGDELWFVTVTTNATGPSSTSINDELASFMLNGYSRSSGLVTSPFTVASGSQHLNVSIDGSTIRELQISAGVYTGSSLAEEVETQVRFQGDTGQPEAGNISFKNASCDFTNGKFELKSGTTSNTYAGTGRTSVLVTDGTTTTGLSSLLGYDVPYESETLAVKLDNVVAISVVSTTLPDTLTLNDATSLVVGDALHLRDSTGTEQNVVVLTTPGGNVITVTPTLSKSWGTDTKVQTLVEADPETVPSSPIDTVDKLIRSKLAAIVSQIDFTS